MLFVIRRMSTSDQPEWLAIVKVADSEEELANMGWDTSSWFEVHNERLFVASSIDEAERITGLRRYSY